MTDTVAAPTFDEAIALVDRAFDLWDLDTNDAKTGSEPELESVLAKLDAYVTTNLLKTERREQQLVGFVTDVLLTMCQYAP